MRAYYSFLMGRIVALISMRIWVLSGRVRVMVAVPHLGGFGFTFVNNCPWDRYGGFLLLGISFLLVCVCWLVGLLFLFLARALGVVWSVS